MLIKNNDTRGWHVAGKMVPPLATVDCPDATEADVKDNKMLEVVKKAKPEAKPAETKPEAK